MANKRDNFMTPNNCGRKEDLLDYLYGELNSAACASFERHLDECDSCRTELSAFGRVRDDLSTWRIGFTPRMEVVLPLRKLELFRELLSSFPVWVRGAALAGAVAAVVLLALSIARVHISVKDGDFALSFGSSKGVTAGSVQSSDELEKLVQNAVARERVKIEDEYRAQMTGFRRQLAAEYKTQLQAMSAEQQAKIQAVRASLKVEIARISRQNRNIRPFFDTDDYADIWSTGR